MKGFQNKAFHGLQILQETTRITDKWKQLSYSPLVLCPIVTFAIMFSLLFWQFYQLFWLLIFLRSVIQKNTSFQEIFVMKILNTFKSKNQNQKPLFNFMKVYWSFFPTYYTIIVNKNTKKFGLFWWIYNHKILLLSRRFFFWIFKSP